jgi:chromosome segregation protein
VSRLKELRLHGFKSFADQTRFVFEPGVNAVIGPNGSGKSNMADAIRWVLGEQSNRSLRTRRADDVIFAGSEQRKPQGMAEAVLTLDNADGWLPIEFAEVSIGRRSYRSGDSEYLINGARARLRDVVELLGEGRLGANELVVVGQGTVDAALSLRPEERRQLFEEAAGVKGLQVKRNEASGRLTKALDNLSRVTDIVGELKPQVRRLALQAEHQQQHDSLGARARGLIATSHRRREQVARSALGDARRSQAAAESALEAFRTSQEAAREELAAAEARYWEAEEAAREAGRAREETRAVVIRAESRLESLEGRIRELATAIERETAELAEAERLLASLDDGSAHAAVSPALTEAAEAEEAWRAAVASLAAADEELLAAEEALSAIRARESDRIAAAARAAEDAARHAARHDQLERERNEARSALATQVAERDRAAGLLEGAAAAARQAADGLEAAVAARDGAQAAADETQQQAVRLSEQLRAVRAEMEAIAEPHDAAVRLGRRLTRAGWPALLDAFAAPEASWPAIEAVVGGELEGALLWSDGDPTTELDDARGTARLLAAGEASGADDRAAALAAVSGEQTLADWVGARNAPLAFHRTVVARDLDALLAGWRRLPPGYSAVTAHGDLADARGLIVLRGRADPPGGAAARAHARRRELGEAVGEIERRLASSQEAAHAAVERLRAARDAHLAASNALDDAERLLRQHRQALEAAAGQVERTERRIADLEAERSRLETAASSADVGAPVVTASAELQALQVHADEARRVRDERSRSATLPVSVGPRPERWPRRPRRGWPADAGNGRLPRRASRS